MRAAGSPLRARSEAHGVHFTGAQEVSVMVSLIRRQQQQQQQEPRRSLARRDPFRSMVRDFFRDPFAMTPSFDWDLSPLRDLEALVPARVFMPDIEVKETKDDYVFQVDVPGVREGDIEVSIAGNRLTITGTRQEEEEREEGAQYHVYERTYGSFSRSFTLPEGVDLEHVKADLRNGVLYVEVPKKAGTGSKQIPIGGTPIREMAPEARAEEKKPEEKKPEEKTPKAA
jgi:HSP20 family protein